MKYWINTAFCLLIPTFLILACQNEHEQIARPKAIAKPKIIPKIATIDPKTKQFIANYDAYFGAAFHNSNIPGAAVAIVKDSQIVFSKGYGFRDMQAHKMMDTSSVFRLGSLSKGFAGVLTGILVKEGVLHWDDPVQKYCPEFKFRDLKQSKRIQIKHLLSQSTGLPYHAFTNLIEDGLSLQKLIKDYFPKTKTYGKEGEYYSYQNAAFCIIEEVIKNATGKPYQQVLIEKILQPNQMHSASCDFLSLNNHPNKVLPHSPTGYGWMPDAISESYYNYAAAGGVNASIADMGQWLLLLLGNKPTILDSITLNQICTPIVKTDKERRILPGFVDGNEAAYAMGWRVLTPENHTIMYHAGYVNGFASEIAFDRERKIGICLLFNAPNDLGKHCVPSFFNLWEENR
jgi:beta-lactamase class C